MLQRHVKGGGWRARRWLVGCNGGGGLVGPSWWSGVNGGRGGDGGGSDSRRWPCVDGDGGVAGGRVGASVVPLVVALAAAAAIVVVVVVAALWVRD